MRHRAALLCAAIVLQGCATNSSLYDARNQFFSGQPQAALTTLETESISGRDRLLAHLDRGLIAHTAGDYEQSVLAFRAATDMLARLDFISVREQSASLVTNDWVSTYKGEYSERLWIHTFQMMNFLLLNRPDSAAVEARQALQVLDKHGDHLRKDVYTRALIAMSFEAAGKPDSAHIEYKKLFQEARLNSGVARRAWQNAKRLGREQDANDFKDLISGKARVGDRKGELVVFLQTGSIPHKTPGEIYIDASTYASFPIYPVIPRPNIKLAVNKDGENHHADVLTLQTVDVSRAALAARGKSIATKQILRVAAKKGIAHALAREDELLGALFSVAFLASEVADTRSWETLPAHVTLVQIPLSEGNHSVELQVREDSNFYNVVIPNVEIDSRRTTYRSLRIGSGAPRLVNPNNLPSASSTLRTP